MAQPTRWLPQQSLSHCTLLQAGVPDPTATGVARGRPLLPVPASVRACFSMTVPEALIRLSINNRLIPIRLSINEKIRK